MSVYQTKDDRMLQAVISDERLVNYYGYNPNDFTSMSDALNSDVVIVQAIAKIIDKSGQGCSVTEIYNEVRDLLTAKI